MPRKSKTDELREKFEVAIAKGLESDSAAERTQALRSAGDLLNPNLTDLQKQLKQAEDAREVAETALKTSQDALDSANVKIAELEPLAAQLPDVTAQYEELKANFDARIADARKELLDESTQKLWAAQRSENAATEKLQDAQRQFGARGQQILLDEVKRIFEENHISEPEDLAKLPAGISPLFLTLFGHSAVRAQLLIAYAKSFPEPSENYTRTLVRCLKAQLPVYEGAPPSDPIEHLQDKIDVLRSLGKKWPGILEEVGRQIDDIQVQRQANFLLNHHAMMQAQSNDAARRGEGRSPIGEPEPVSGVPLGEHDSLCVCKICSPNLRRPGSLDVIGGEESF